MPPKVQPLATADLADKHIGSLDDALQASPPTVRAVPRGAFRSFGPVAAFAGRAVIVACLRSNSTVRTVLEQPGDGRVLVVKICDPLAARRCAFLGDNLAALLVANGWAGAVVAGSVRDAAAMRGIDGLGVVALGACPLKSARAPMSPHEVDLCASEAGEGVDLRAAGDGSASGAAGWAVVRSGEFLYVDEDGFVISDRELSLD
jgi:regulator of ribonuclease activity A